MVSTTCPLCGENNNCQIEQSTTSKDCWCFYTAIPQELLARIPETDRNKTCVCSHCVNSFKKSQPQ